MSEQKRYIVTLKKGENLDSFYSDMETIGGTARVPDREVVCQKRRPTSRNTVYYLTDEEAETLKEDSRIISVEQPLKDRGIIAKPFYEQTSSSWDRSWTQDASDDNWGLKRCIDGQTSNWGSNDITAISGTIKTTSSGKNVDVVIVDDHIDPNHPEYAVNSDGTGGSRVNQINWYDYAISGAPSLSEDIGLTYDYTIYGEHGSHVAGTVAGNTQGWARDANIYNIDAYGYESNLESDETFEYIRLFHNNKPINPETGRRNPTVVNNSWGFIYTIDESEINLVEHRGSISGAPLTENNLNDLGIDTTYYPTLYLPISSAAVEADIQDCIDDGIIIVAAAGNDNMKLTNVGLQDWDNRINVNAGNIYYNLYSTPAATPNVISVGSIENEKEEPKALYSNCGPRVDIYAPGTAIQSSFTTDDYFGEQAIGTYPADPRGGGYLGKIQGTSMASPQVTGVIACLLEQEPFINQAEVLEQLKQYADKDVMFESGTDSNDQDVESLQGGENLMLRYIRKRPLSGQSYPRINYKSRPTSGSVYPRTNIRRK